MIKYLLTAIMVASSMGMAQASTIDLTDGIYSNETYDFAGPVNFFQENVDGVTFSFSAGQFRAIGPWSGNAIVPSSRAIAIGGGGGSSTSFTLMASADVSLEAFWGFGQQYNTNPIFDVTGTGVSSTGNTFGTVGFVGTATPGSNSFVGGPLSLLANTLYTFTVTNSGLSTQGYLMSIDFTSSTSTVPLPAGLPLLMGGLGVLGLVGRKRRKA